MSEEIESLRQQLARVTAENERHESGEILMKCVNERDELRQQLARVTLERDEAVGLLREIRDRWPWIDYPVPLERIKAYLSRLDQPQSPEQEKP